MLWLITDKASYQIMGCNLAERNGIYEVWVERPNGTTRKVYESTDEHGASVVRNAIDFAIEKKDPVLRLN